MTFNLMLRDKGFLILNAIIHFCSLSEQKKNLFQMLYKNIEEKQITFVFNLNYSKFPVFTKNMSFKRKLSLYIFLMPFKKK